MSSETGDSESIVSGNQANIPAYIRRELDIDDGDQLRWRIEDDGTLRVQVVQQGSGTFETFEGYEGDRETDVTAQHDSWGINIEQMPGTRRYDRLFAVAYSPDNAHKSALPILQGIDTAALPEAVVVDYVLAETLNGLTTPAGHAAETDFLDRIEENTRFHMESLTGEAFAAGKALFRQYEQFSFVDACVDAYMQTEGLGYLYAFEDDYDAADDVYRLDSPTNPYQPK